MKKYRVWAKSIGYCYLDVEAENEEEAFAKAYETDGGEYTEDSGDWEYGEIMEVEE